MPFFGKAATARKPSKINGYSDFMIFPKNKKFSPNLVFGDFFMFLGTFLGKITPFWEDKMLLGIVKYQEVLLCVRKVTREGVKRRI